MDCTLTEEFIVELENRPGTLGQLTQVLGKGDITILGLAAVAHNGEGTVHLLTDDAATTEVMLEEAQYTFSTRQALTVSAPESLGQLSMITNRLGQAGINIEACFVSRDPSEDAVWYAFAVSDAEKALEIVQGIG